MTSSADPVHLGTTDLGYGDAVVFTHGWIDDRSAWADVIEFLSSSLHCLSWDLRGHGESAIAPPGQYTRDHALADMERIVSRVGVPTVLVGHSLGGYLSLAYALRHPTHVRALVLVAAGPGFRDPEAREEWNRNVDASAAKLGVPDGSEVISKHVDSWVIDSLDQITAPAAVIVGEYDKRFQASAAVFEKYLDVRTNLVIAEAGHAVHKKRPAEVAAAITTFLADLGAPQPTVPGAPRCSP
jgi:pimeloyl-ACP methyl ester carboxylesterase